MNYKIFGVLNIAYKVAIAIFLWTRKQENRYKILLKNKKLITIENIKTINKKESKIRAIIVAL